MTNQEEIAHSICKFFTDHGISEPERRQKLFEFLSGYDSKKNLKIALTAVIHNIFLDYDNFVATKTREKIEVLMSQMIAKDQKIKELQAYIDNHILK